ncbi:hypothetical protein ACQCSX_14645 [Pseudarthrobacter sp. P1]|uniref:hypothetical protein n=1 Tax=Pseudarthrobacter sp. P1 TaxID=3418418 RepID=UPI003CE8E088
MNGFDGVGLPTLKATNTDLLATAASARACRSPASTTRSPGPAASRGAWAGMAAAEVAPKPPSSGWPA